MGPKPELRVVHNPAVILTLVYVMVDRREFCYATVSESNFGSVHHVTLPSNDLSRALAKIDRGIDDSGDEFPTLKTGSVWQNHPYRGIVTIWEVDETRGKNRSVNLTYDQVCELMDYFFPKK